MIIRHRPYTFNVGADPVPARCPCKGHIHSALFPAMIALTGKRAGTGPAPTLANHRRVYADNHFKNAYLLYKNKPVFYLFKPRRGLYKPWRSFYKLRRSL